MVTQIFVEGFELDLTDDIACELSYVIDDVKDFGSKNTSYSKTIVIQGTQRNNKVFNHISELGRFLAIENINTQGLNVNENYTAANGSNCVILVDNIQIFKGKLRVLEVVRYANHVEYECAVFGELGGFYYELSKGISNDISNTNTGTKLLEQLYLEDLNHTYNWTNINASWDNRNTNPGVGYFYPLINYGKVDGTALHDFHEQALRPAIYVREYIKRIFNLVGYTYHCSFFDSDFFKRLVVPNNDDRLKILVSQLLNIGTTQYNFGLTAVSPYTFLWYAGSFRDFSSIGSGQYQYTGASTINNTDFNFFMNLSIVGQGFYAIKLFKNGLEVAILDNFQTSNQGTTNDPFIYAKNLSTVVNLVTNDIYKIVIEYLPYVGGLTSTITTNNSTWYINTSAKVGTDANIGDTISMNYAVPKNIKITDFFTSILKMFNLYVVEDKFIPKRLIITPYIDFYTNETLDWTNKLDRSQEIRLKPMGELNARVFNFKFKQDDAYHNKLYKEKYNEGYMDYTYDSEYEYAKDKEDLEVIFSSTVNYAPNGEEKVIPYLATYDPVNGTQDIKSSNIRILQTKMINVNTTWKLSTTSGSTIQNSINRYPYSGMWEDPRVPDNGTYFQSLGWASPNEIYYTITGTSVNYGLFNAFWSPYFAEITDPNSIILTAHFWLTMMDIRTLDFSKNILIDGTIWRINKIDNYNPLLSVPTRVELLKVIDNTFDYNQYVAGYKDRLNLAGAFYEGEACLVNKINNLELI